jgi:hypothetical protein
MVRDLPLCLLRLMIGVNVHRWTGPAGAAGSSLILRDERTAQEMSVEGKGE